MSQPYPDHNAVMSTRDGGHLAGVQVRPIEPADGAALQAFHGTLSDRTVHLRFFGPHPTLTAGDVAYFTQVDHVSREALVAVVGPEIVGVARFDDLGEGRAEIAFVVTDAWQGRGVGGLLLRALAERAKACGVTTFVADVLPGNARMLALVHACGWSLREHLSRGVVTVEMDLTARVEG